MQRLYNIISRNSTFFLFVFLWLIALGLTIQSHRYHKSSFISSTNFFSRNLYSISSNINSYFNLKNENRILVEENRRLKELEYALKNQTNDITSNYKFEIIKGKVVKNEYSFQNNFLTLNKGKKDSIQLDQGVINSKGIVGVIDKTSSNYSRAVSILNSTSRVNVKLKNSNHFGSLIWNGKSLNIMQVEDISKFAKVSIGDTLITGGYSNIFPEGILVGQVIDFNSQENSDSYKIELRLFNDISDLDHVFIIKNNHKKEIDSLMIN